MDIYFISGLGADKRVFQKLVLPGNFALHYIEWLPVSREESLVSYCQRLSVQIDQTRPFILIGLSFGGIIAIELSKMLAPRQTIIISSFSSRKQVSPFYIFIGKTRLYNLIPVGFLLRPNPVIFRRMGAGTEERQKMLIGILKETDPSLFRWAVNQLFNWDNHWEPENFLHIHGTADKILPYRKSMQAIQVKGGEHLMVYSRAEEVSALLIQHLYIA